MPGTAPAAQEGPDEGFGLLAPAEGVDEGVDAGRDLPLWPTDSYATRCQTSLSQLAALMISFAVISSLLPGWAGRYFHDDILTIPRASSTPRRKVQHLANGQVADEGSLPLCEAAEFADVGPRRHPGAADEIGARKLLALGRQTVGQGAGQRGLAAAAGASEDSQLAYCSVPLAHSNCTRYPGGRFLDKLLCRGGGSPCLPFSLGRTLRTVSLLVASELYRVGGNVYKQVKIEGVHCNSHSR